MFEPLFKIDNKKYIIYTDGGARGNPGPAAIGAVVNGKRFGEYIGETTNNVAEYSAVIFALKKASELLGKEAKQTEVEVRSDSELLVKQMNHIYRVKEDTLKVLYVDVLNAVLDFKRVTFVHIPRTQNKEADAMVNEALDAE